MKYRLSRKRKHEKVWRTSTQGDMGYIITVLQLNLHSPELKEFEWKIEHIDY